MTNDLLVREIKECRICGGKNLVPILSLGELYVSDFLAPDERERGIKAPLELVLCKRETGGCGLLQLKHAFPPEKLYGETYWYRSGINQTMRDALKNIADCVKSMAELRRGDYVVDIGSNDSTLLRAYSVPGLNTVGFEPSRNLIPYGEPGVTKVINDFFNAAAWEREFPEKLAKVVTAIAMFYDLDDPNAFVADVGRVLDNDGLFVVQQAYLPYILEKNIIDNTVHEHLEYHSLMSMRALMERHNMEIFDVELNDVNAGSFRTYIRKKGGGESIKVFPGAERRIKELERWEEKLGIDKEKTYKEFAERAEKIKNRVAGFINGEIKKGKKVYVYGASTKGNTLLQYFGLDHSQITAAAERNRDKWGKVTVGSRIPIVSEEEARAARPDYFLVLPWQFMEEFMEREKEFLRRGGKFIMPLPEFRVLGFGDKL